MRKALPITDSIRRAEFPFELKAATTEAGDGAGEFTGYAAGIHNIDKVGDMIIPGAFEKELDSFVATGGLVCWQHNRDWPIGKCIEAREDHYGLFTRSAVSDTSLGRDAMTLIRDGVVKRLSIGYRVPKGGWQEVDRAGLVAYLAESGLPEARQAEILGQYDELEFSSIYLLKTIRLYEYSPVSIPANDNAIITTAKDLEFMDSMKFGDQTQLALGAIKRVTERAREIQRIRETKGGAISPARIEEMKALRGEMEELAKAIDSFITEKADPPAGQKLYLEFIKLQSHLNGIGRGI